MAYKKKTTTDRVPPNVAFALQHGKSAYQQHPSWKVDPDDQAVSIFLICGKLIRDPDVGRQLWAQYRGDLLRRQGIKSWWAYKEFEGRNAPNVFRANDLAGLTHTSTGGRRKRRLKGSSELLAS